LPNHNGATKKHKQVLHFIFRLDIARPLSL